MSIWMSGIGEIRVVHPPTNATQNTKALANRIKNEVNLVSWGENDAPKRASSTLHELYVRAFESCDLKRRVYKVERATLFNANKFTDEKVVVDGMSGKFMGKVTPGWTLKFEVVLAVDDNPDMSTPVGRRAR